MEILHQLADKPADAFIPPAGVIYGLLGTPTGREVLNTLSLPLTEELLPVIDKANQKIIHLPIGSLADSKVGPVLVTLALAAITLPATEKSLPRAAANTIIAVYLGAYILRLSIINPDVVTILTVAGIGATIAGNIAATHR